MMSESKVMSLEQAKERYSSPLTRIVLEWLSIMERVVSLAKQPLIEAEQWGDLAELMDTTKFRRVGNYGVKNNWTSYRASHPVGEPRMVGGLHLAGARGAGVLR